MFWLCILLYKQSLFLLQFIFYNNDTMEDDMDEEENIALKFPNDLCSKLKPLHLLSVWKEPKTLTPCITVSIILSSGV